MKNKTFITHNLKKIDACLKATVIGSVLIFALALHGQETKAPAAPNNNKDNDLLQQYIQSKGNNTIVFDSSNIKQFWVDRSVVSRNDHIEVLINNDKKAGFKSLPFKIQLANVIENQDCNIEIISENPDISFSVFNSKEKKLATSSKKDSFIHYSLFSGMFHLEDTDDFSFNIQFSSPNKKEYISLKKIILSFSPNPESVFPGSPGYDNLMKQFKEKGLSVPDSEVQYIFSKDHKILYFKIPYEMATSQRFFYHVYPVSKDDLTKPEKAFNTLDFYTKKKKVMIPAPYSSDNQFAIIQVILPSYPCSLIDIGQIQEKRLWTLKLKDNENLF